MVESEQVENGGVEVVQAEDVLFRLPTEFVGASIAEGCVDARSRQPGRKAEGVVVPSAGSLLEGGHAPELGAPDHQDVVQ